MAACLARKDVAMLAWNQGPERVERRNALLVARRSFVNTLGEWVPPSVSTTVPTESKRQPRTLLLEP